MHIWEWNALATSQAPGLVERNFMLKIKEFEYHNFGTDEYHQFALRQLLMLRISATFHLRGLLVSYSPGDVEAQVRSFAFSSLIHLRFKD